MPGAPQSLRGAPRRRGGSTEPLAWGSLNDAAGEAGRVFVLYGHAASNNPGGLRASAGRWAGVVGGWGAAGFGGQGTCESLVSTLKIWTTGVSKTSPTDAPFIYAYCVPVTRTEGEDWWTPPPSMTSIPMGCFMR